MAAPFKLLRRVFLHFPAKYGTTAVGTQCTHTYIFSRSCHNSKFSNEVNKPSIEEDEEEREDEDVEIRLRILDAAIQFVPEYGWSRKALSAGAESLGLPGVAHGMLNGGEELVMNFMYFNNRKLDKILSEKYKGIKQSKDLNVFFHDALKTRLEMIIPVANKWSEALAILMQPECIPEDLELLLDMSIVVWSHTSDTNVYMKWYTKRLSLALAYRLSEMYMTQDSSPDYSATWEFLKTQVDRVLSADRSIEEAEKNFNELTNTFCGIFNTVQNLIGANKFR